LYLQSGGIYKPKSVLMLGVRRAQGEPVVDFDVGVDDGDHLAALVSQPLLHGGGVGEETAVPGEVALA